MEYCEIERLAKKGDSIVENFGVVTFENVKVTGLATSDAKLTVYTQSRDMEIECACYPAITYPLVFPAVISDYCFHENNLSVEMRSGDGRRLRDFDSEWWPISFESRYDYERMVALICYYCTHEVADEEDSFTTDFTYNVDSEFESLDDAPLLSNVRIEEYSFTGRLEDSDTYDIRFMSKPVERMPNIVGGFGRIQNGEIVQRMCFSKYDKCVLSVNTNNSLFQIKRDLQGGDSEIWTFSSNRDFEVALQCLEWLYGIDREVQRSDDVVICPVCKRKSSSKSHCRNCGFSDLEPTFVSKEDAEYWLENVVHSFRNQWQKRTR